MIGMKASITLWNMLCGEKDYLFVKVTFVDPPAIPGKVGCNNSISILYFFEQRNFSKSNSVTIQGSTLTRGRTKLKTFNISLVLTKL